jgi:hypothetical protein
MLHLEGVSNGASVSWDLATDTDSVTIQAPSDVALTGVNVSQTRVTAGQNADWTVTMHITNNGGTDIQLDPVATGLTFAIFQQGDKTGEYTVVEPSVFSGSGNDTLASGANDSLTFVVDVTGTTAGPLTVTGTFAGTDLTTSQPVSVGGVSASLLVETQAALSITSITPSQTTVTTSQDSTWTVTMVVANAGQSEVVLDSTSIAFNLGTGWAYDPQVLAGDSVLAGNTSKNLTFTMTKAGDTAGAARIDGYVSGVQSNDAAAKSANTTVTGSGSVTVQDSALLVVSAIRPLKDPVTMGQNNPWSVEVDVTNSGQATAELDLGATSLDFPAKTSPGAISAPTTGNTTLPAAQTTTLTFVVGTTPMFATPGRQEISASVAGTELNTGAMLQAMGADSVTVDTIPVP